MTVQEYKDIFESCKQLIEKNDMTVAYMKLKGLTQKLTNDMNVDTSFKSALLILITHEMKRIPKDVSELAQVKSILDIFNI